MMLPFPPVRLPSRDWARLMQLAFDAKYDRHPVAAFLRAEVHRAIVTEHDGDDDDDVVRLNAWVTYHVDWEPAESRLLVHPDDFGSARLHLSVLSPVGAALLGIRAGDRMPFLSGDGGLRLVTALGVRQEPTMLRLFCPESAP